MAHIIRNVAEVGYRVLGNLHGGCVLNVCPLMGSYPEVPELAGNAEELGSPTQFIHYHKVPPKSEIANHKHEDSEEWYFFVKGTGVMYLDGDEHIVKPGDLILTQAGGEHGFINTSGDFTEFLVSEIYLNPERKKKHNQEAK